MQPTKVHRNTSQNGARAKIMRALYTEGMLPIPEICELCGLTAKQSRDNLGAAKNDGLVVAERDDVTSRLAFKLTADGKKWVTDRGLHLKNSKASQEADAADAPEAAAAIGEAIEDTRDPVVEEAPSVAATAEVDDGFAAASVVRKKFLGDGDFHAGGYVEEPPAAEAVVDSEKLLPKPPDDESDGILCFTVDETGQVRLHNFLWEAVEYAKDAAQTHSVGVAVYRLLLVGKTRTTVDFVAEDATA